jgi:hypothetical protein
MSTVTVFSCTSQQRRRTRQWRGEVLHFHYVNTTSGCVSITVHSHDTFTAFLMQISSTQAGLSGRVVEFESLWPLVCWDCGLESRRVMDVCLL